MESCGYSFQVELCITSLGLDHCGSPRLELVPCSARLELFDGLECLRHLAWAGQALHLSADIDSGIARAARCILQSECKIGTGGDAGAQFIADEPGELQQGNALDGGTQVGFISDALLVECQYIGDGCPAVKQGNGEIIVFPRAQAVENRKILSSAR